MADMFTNQFGEIVDLDELYEEHLKSSEELINSLDCIKELGYALYYMQYLHPDVDWGDQRQRVDKLCKKFKNLRDRECSDYQEITSEGLLKEKWNRIWFKFHYKILDEIENMC